MKKKFGFTLAEVLITLTVIGVVAALAAPVLSGAFQKSKVGPSLRKVVGTIENANELLLHRNDSDRLSYAIAGSANYIEALSKIVKGAAPATEADKRLSHYSLKNYDGTAYALNEEGNALVFNLESGESIAILTREVTPPVGNAGSAAGIYADMIYDLNGFEKAPNKWGKDLFVFVIDDNGSVVPKFSKAYANTYTNASTNTWKELAANLCTDTTVKTGVSCTGSIADNFWKVIYKY